MCYLCSNLDSFKAELAGADGARSWGTRNSDPWHANSAAADDVGGSSHDSGGFDPTIALTIPGNNTTSATISVGGTFNSQVDFAGDTDWVAVQLTAGIQYQIDLTTPASNLDPIVTLLSAGGAYLDSNDDIVPGSNTDSQIIYTATTTGTHYIEAAGYDTSTGAYQMAVTSLGVPPPSSPLDAIDWGYVAPATINVYFVPGGRSVRDPFNDTMTSIGWTAFEQQQAELAFQNVSNVANVTFNVVANPASADFFMVQANSIGALGYWAVSGGSVTINGVGYTVDGLGVFDASWSEANMSVGGFDYVTMLHEIGHGMGLAHPHDDGGSSTVMNGVSNDQDRGDFDMNQGINTTMTYVDGWQTAPHGPTPAQNYGYQGTFMALDIAVLQASYGANTSYNSSDTTYTLPGTNSVGTFYTAIWDGGGTDEIVYGGSLAAIINLNTATLDYSATGGGSISYAAGIHGGFTIADNVVIENATGGVGADTVTGNEFPNTLRGGFGNDDLFGNSGNDTLIGGLGADDLSGGGGIDTASYADHNGVTVNLATGFTLGGGSGGDTFLSIENLTGSALQADELTGNNFANELSGGGGNDFLNGSTGTDTLLGEAGNDTLVGGPGGDTLNGGAGADTAFYANSATGVSINLTTNSFSGGDAAGDTYFSIENVLGSTGADTLTGSSGINVLNGNNGNDTLAGLAGADDLFGGNGTDTVTYAASNAAVTVNLMSTVGSFGHAAGDFLVSIENVIGSDFNDNLTGTTGANVMTGGSGADSFNSSIGDDQILGGGGNDVMVGGAGADAFDGGANTDWVYYSNSAGAVNANMLTNSGSGADAAGDTFGEVENVFGSTSGDTLSGDNLSNVLNGFSGNDFLFGNGDDDTLLGGLGNDTLNGGGDDDVLSGYLGSDVFAFSSAAFGQDVVISFDNGSDQISLAGSGLTFASFTETAAGPGTRLTLTADPDNFILILGTPPAQIDATDFIV